MSAWDLVSGENITSLLPSSEPVTALQVTESQTDLKEARKMI